MSTLPANQVDVVDELPIQVLLESVADTPVELAPMKILFAPEVLELPAR